MALIECGECKRQISDTAASCPGCGAPQKAGAAVSVSAEPAEKKTGSGKLIVTLALSALVFGALYYADQQGWMTDGYPACDSPASKKQFAKVFNESPHALKENLRVIDVLDLRLIEDRKDPDVRVCNATLMLNSAAEMQFVFTYSTSADLENVYIEGKPKLTKEMSEALEALDGLAKLGEALSEAATEDATAEMETVPVAETVSEVEPQPLPEANDSQPFDSGPVTEVDQMESDELEFEKPYGSVKADGYFEDYAE